MKGQWLVMQQQQILREGGTFNEAGVERSLEPKLVQRKTS